MNKYLQREGGYSMYKKRRIEEIIYKELSKISVRVRKFAYNEYDPNMQLKYGIGY